MSSDRPRLRDIPFDPIDVATLVSRIAEATRADRLKLVATVNLDFLRIARSDDAFLALLRQRTWLNVVDGWPIGSLLRRQRASVARATGSDLLPALLADTRTSAQGVFLLGDTEATAEALRKTASERGWLGAIRGMASPPPEDFADTRASRRIVTQVNESKAHILCVALGAPRQEFWLDRWATELHPVVGIGLGGAFRFLAAPATRAPRWMQHAGLEWMYRMMREPRRLGPRYARDIVELYRLMRESRTHTPRSRE